MLRLMQPLLTKLLKLPGIEVEDYTDCGGQLILEVEERQLRQSVLAVNKRTVICSRIIGA
jgi:hypothetical protein